MTDQLGGLSPPPPPPAPEPPAVSGPWRRTAWFTALALVAVFPLGLLLMWTRRPGWGRVANWMVTGVVALAAALLLVGVTRSTLHPQARSGPSAALPSPRTPTTGAPTTGTPTIGTPTPAPSSSASHGTKPTTTAPPSARSPGPALSAARNLLVWPFAGTSIWNTPVGRAATYVPAGIAPASQRSVATDQDVIIMRPTAPLTPIAYNGAGWSGASRCGGGGTVLATAPIPSNLIVPGSSGNYAFAILMPDGHTVLQGQPLARCTAGGAATALHLAPSADLRTDGTLGAHGGSGLSSLGGTIRLGELTPGAPPIRHALKVNLDGAADYWPVGFRWPAVKEDSYGPQRYRGKVPALKMGALLALPASLNLASLNLQTTPGRMIAWTLQNYGAYCVDDAGRSVNSIATELGPDGSVTDQFQKTWGVPFVSGVNDTPWARDIASIFAHLAVVDNNSPTSIGGGGTLLQSYAPPYSAIGTASSPPLLSTAAVLADQVSAPNGNLALTVGGRAPQPTTPVLLVRRDVTPAFARGPPA